MQLYHSKEGLPNNLSRRRFRGSGSSRENRRKNSFVNPESIFKEMVSSGVVGKLGGCADIVGQETIKSGMFAWVTIGPAWFCDLFDCRRFLQQKSMFDMLSYQRNLSKHSSTKVSRGPPNFCAQAPNAFVLRALGKAIGLERWEHRHKPNTFTNDNGSKALRYSSKHPKILYKKKQKPQASI